MQLHLMVGLILMVLVATAGCTKRNLQHDITDVAAALKMWELEQKKTGAPQSITCLKLASVIIEADSTKELDAGVSANVQPSPTATANANATRAGASKITIQWNGINDPDKGCTSPPAP